MKLINFGDTVLQGFCWGVIGMLITGSTALSGGQGVKAGGTGQAAETISLEGVRSVLGAANDFASGVVDMTKNGEEIVIAYRFYDPDAENYESDFAFELAPKIQALYKKFPGLKRLQLQVTANDPSSFGLWKPFVDLALDRKTIEETHWTGFLAKYLLDQTLRSRK